MGFEPMIIVFGFLKQIQLWALPQSACIALPTVINLCKYETYDHLSAMMAWWNGPSLEYCDDFDDLATRSPEPGLESPRGLNESTPII